ncbi:MAG: hypothetical protein ACE5GA_08265, partial [Candidatus Zixiibacteriota bacterium]
MMIRRALLISLTAAISLLSQDVTARALYDNPGAKAMEQINALNRPAEESPFVEIRAHNIGALGLSVTNQGTFGNGFAGAADCDGELCPSGEFPINSNINYLFAGSFWVGAVVGRDTLVS